MAAAISTAVMTTAVMTAAVAPAVMAAAIAAATVAAATVAATVAAAIAAAAISATVIADSSSHFCASSFEPLNLVFLLVNIVVVEDALCAFWTNPASIDCLLEAVAALLHKSLIVIELFCCYELRVSHTASIRIGSYPCVVRASITRLRIFEVLRHVCVFVAHIVCDIGASSIVGKEFLCIPLYCY